MAGIITTGSFTKSLWPGVNKWHQDAYDEWPVEYLSLFDKHSSRKAYEDDVGMSGLGLFQVKPETSPIAYQTMQQGFISRYTHATYGNGFAISEEAVEDDQYELFAKKRSQELARSARETMEILGASVYNRAFDPLFTGGDGVSLINSAHPTIAGGTYSNTLAVAADLSEASLEQALIDIGKLADESGKRAAVRAKSLIIPVDLEFVAARILRSPFTPGSANNAINAIVNTGKFKDGATLNHFLTDTNAWFIRTSVTDGMKYFERKSYTFAPYTDFDTKNSKFAATFRCSFGWTDPRGLYGSAGL